MDDKEFYEATRGGIFHDFVEPPEAPKTPEEKQQALAEFQALRNQCGWLQHTDQIASHDDERARPARAASIHDLQGNPWAQAGMPHYQLDAAAISTMLAAIGQPQMLGTQVVGLPLHAASRGTGSHALAETDESAVRVEERAEGGTPRGGYLLHRCHGCVVAARYEEGELDTCREAARVVVDNLKGSGF